MKFFPKLFMVFTFMLFCLGSRCQIDTSELKMKVMELKCPEDHYNFWKRLNQRDQQFRNIRTSHLIDFENLVSASYYLNEYGYPSLPIGRRTISLIWVHCSLPELKQEAFPLIHCGLIEEEVSEKIIRIYYLRNFYWYRNFDELNRTKDFELFLADLGVNKGCKIDICNLVNLYTNCMQFLQQDWRIIGRWKCPRQSSPLQIIKSEDDKFYYQKEFSDSSFYPLRVIQDEVDSLKFGNHYKLDFLSIADSKIDYAA